MIFSGGKILPLGDCMNLLDAIVERRSIRKFEEKEIPLELIEKVLKAGQFAPSGGNRQPWRFIVVNDKSLIKDFDQTYHQPWVENAPAVIVACVNPHDTWQKYGEEDDCYILDVSAAIQNMLLAIHGLGLGGVWILSCDKHIIRKKLNIPLHWQIVSIIPFGYFKPKEVVRFNIPGGDKVEVVGNSERRRRKKLSEIAFLNSADNIFDAK